MDHTDIVQISLCSPQAVPFWASLRNNQRSCLVPSWCSKVHAFMNPVILPSGSGLGVYNKVIILKTWKISLTQFLTCCVSRCCFWEISQGCESTLLGIPTTSSPFCFCRSRYAIQATSFFINSQMVSLMHLRTRHQTVKNIHPDIVPSNPPPKVLIHIMGLSSCKLSSISSNTSVSGSNYKWAFCILEIVACNWSNV